MKHSHLLSLGAFALVAGVGVPLHAQGTTSVQLAFGYECGDRFLVRNDGTDPVVLEYATAGSADKSQLHLSGRQTAEIASAQSGNMELWVGGKVVASEPKGNRPCAANGSPNGAGVTVRPLDQGAPAAAAPADSGQSAAPVVVYAPQNDYYPYGYYPYGYYPYGYYPYSYYGISPFFYPSISIRGGGFGRGPVFRGGRGSRGGRGRR